LRKETVNRYLIAVAAALTLACGPAVDITTNRDASVPLPKQPAWAWGRRDTVSHYELDPRAQNPILHDRVRQAIEATLAKKGWKLVDDPTQAQAIITYHVGMRSSVVYQTTTTAMSPGGGWWGGYGWGYYGAPTYLMSTTTPEDYHEGALLVIVRDPQGQVAWHGLYKKEIEDVNVVSAENIKAAVEELLADLK
jgi:hypothetical protein